LKDITKIIVKINREEYNRKKQEVRRRVKDKKGMTDEAQVSA